MKKGLMILLVMLAFQFKTQAQDNEIKYGGLLTIGSSAETSIPSSQSIFGYGIGGFLEKPLNFKTPGFSIFLEGLYQRRGFNIPSTSSNGAIDGMDGSNNKVNFVDVIPQLKYVGEIKPDILGFVSAGPYLSLFLSGTNNYTSNQSGNPVTISETITTKEVKAATIGLNFAAGIEYQKYIFAIKHNAANYASSQTASITSIKLSYWGLSIGYKFN